jgi:hypothetical protein
MVPQMNGRALLVVVGRADHLRDAESKRDESSGGQPRQDSS